MSASKANPRPDSEGVSPQAAEFFEKQATSTAPLRRFLYRKAFLGRRQRVLDAGCGAGVISAELSRATGAKVTGLDSDAAMVEFAARAVPGAEFVNARVEDMPFGDESFDAVVCHFFLLWVTDPRQAFSEMVRVLEPGGVLVACAEPDYGGLVEYPENPVFSRGRIEGMTAMGADPFIGRKLDALFNSAGLRTKSGVSATLMHGSRLARDLDIEKEMLERELSSAMSPDEAASALAKEAEQRRSGKVVTVPIFWAIGFK